MATDAGAGGSDLKDAQRAAISHECYALDSMSRSAAHKAAATTALEKLRLLSASLPACLPLPATADEPTLSMLDAAPSDVRLIANRNY